MLMVVLVLPVVSSLPNALHDDAAAAGGGVFHYSSRATFAYVSTPLVDVSC